MEEEYLLVDTPNRLLLIFNICSLMLCTQINSLTLYSANQFSTHQCSNSGYKLGIQNPLYLQDKQESQVGSYY